MKRDPVCNLLVEEAAAVPLDQGNKTFYFCSASCRDKFLQEGEQKTSPGAKSPEAERRARAAQTEEG